MDENLIFDLTRQALWINDLSWLDKPLRQHWPKLAGIGMIKTTQYVEQGGLAGT